jgi:hypothetical protein
VCGKLGFQDRKKGTIKKNDDNWQTMPSIDNDYQ